MNVTVDMEGFDGKYMLFGYVFSFIGSLTFVELLIAFGLGFVGAFGGWVFEKIKKRYLDNIKHPFKLKNKK